MSLPSILKTNLHNTQTRDVVVVVGTTEQNLQSPQQTQDLHEKPETTTFSTNTNISQWHQEEQQEFQAIVADFERRLKEQVQLAREDVLRELENQFQVMYSLD